MGKLDIVQWTDQSIPSAHDNPKIYACFGLYPRLFTGNKFIYKGAMVSNDFEKPEICVIKTRRFRPGTERYWQGEIDLNRYANQIAVAFTDQTLAAKIDLVDQYIAPLHGHTKWNKVCLKMKPNYFRKLLKFEIVLIENAVRNVQMLTKDKVLEAFSHFTYCESNEQNLLHSFRGAKTGEGKYLLLTPDMFTHKFDIHMWFQKHTCNNICGKFKRPIETSQPEKPLDVDNDTLYYNFDNDKKQVNEKENFSKETKKESGEKHVNFETTFGGKSCDGTYSVVTALVHSGIEGKCETMAPTEMNYLPLSVEEDTQNNNVNFNENPEDLVSEENSNHARVSVDCLDGGHKPYDPDKVLSIEQCDLNRPDFEDKYLQTALLARDENILDNTDGVIEYNEPNNAHMEASTLVIRAVNPYHMQNTDNEIQSLPFETENNIFTEEKPCQSIYTTGSEFDILDISPCVDTPDDDKEKCFEERNENIYEPQGPRDADILPDLSPEVQRKLQLQYEIPGNIEKIIDNENGDEFIADNLDETQCDRDTPFKLFDNLECQIISPCDKHHMLSDEFVTGFTGDTRAEKINLETSSSSSSSLDITQNITTTEIISKYVPRPVESDFMSSYAMEHEKQNEPEILHIEENSDFNGNGPNEIQMGYDYPCSETADGKMINSPTGYETENAANSITEQTPEYSTDSQESRSSYEVEYQQPGEQKSLRNKENISDFNDPPAIQNVICENDGMPTSNATYDKTNGVPEICDKYNYTQTENEIKVKVGDHNAIVESAESSQSDAQKLYCEYSEIELNSESHQHPSDKNDLIEIVPEHISEYDSSLNDSNSTEINELYDILRKNEYDGDNSESKIWSHPDFLEKYNLQNFVDHNEKSSDRIIQSTCILHNIEEQRKEVMVNLSTPNPASVHNDTVEPEIIQKPLQSSLRKQKQKYTPKSVKFADDVKGECYLQRQQTVRVLLHKPPNGMTMMCKNSELQINSAVLEQCETNVNLRDPNWYTHIPCECCDNENITGRD